MPSCRSTSVAWGLLDDVITQRRRLVRGLIFTACYSRSMFCWLTFDETLATLIEGFEQAWLSFGGIFRVVIPNSLKAIVIEADPITPRFNAGFLEYAQARGFVVDPLACGGPAISLAWNGSSPTAAARGP